MDSEDSYFHSSKKRRLSVCNVDKCIQCSQKILCVICDTQMVSHRKINEVCAECNRRTTDRDGNSLSFAFTDTDFYCYNNKDFENARYKGGSIVINNTTPAKKLNETHQCFIDGIACYAFVGECGSIIVVKN